MMKIIGYFLGVVSLTVLAGGSGWGQAVSHCGPSVPSPQTQPRPIQSTVNVSVVPAPLPPYCPMPRRRGYACPQPVKPLPVPVRLNVSVTPQCPEEKRMAPVVYHSPGPIKPVVQNAVGLAGAIVALPFRVADMFLPAYHPALSLEQGRQGYGQGRYQGPMPFPPSSPGICPPPKPWMPTVCPPPLCRIPLRSTPVGPSVAPLPGPGPPQPCQPFLPARMVEDPDEYSCLEPQGILAGLINLPFRFCERARLWGDLSPRGYTGQCGR